MLDAIQSGEAWADYGIADLYDRIDWLNRELLEKGDERDPHHAVRQNSGLWTAQGHRLANMLVRDREAIQRAYHEADDADEDLFDLVEGATDLAELKAQYAEHFERHRAVRDQRVEEMDQRLIGSRFMRPIIGPDKVVRPEECTCPHMAGGGHVGKCRSAR